MKTKLTGIIPPLVTPLAGPDTLDTESLQRMLDHVIEGGVCGVFILGTTGEAPSLCYCLRRELIAKTCEHVNGRVPVLVGITDTSVGQAMMIAQTAADCGADIVVLGVPYYFPISQEQLFGYVNVIAEQCPLPIYLYNKPDCMKTVYEPGTLDQLCDIEKIIGIKDSSGDFEYFQSLIPLKQKRPDWSIWMGPEKLLSQGLAIGADGGVSGGANLHPRLYTDLYRAAIEKRQHDIDTLQENVHTLNSAVYRPNFTGGIKYALSQLGLCREILAPPLTPADEEQKQRINKFLRELKN